MKFQSLLFTMLVAMLGFGQAPCLTFYDHPSGGRVSLNTIQVLDCQGSQDGDEFWLNYWDRMYFNNLMLYTNGGNIGSGTVLVLTASLADPSYTQCKIALESNGWTVTGSTTPSSNTLTNYDLVIIGCEGGASCGSTYRSNLQGSTFNTALQNYVLNSNGDVIITGWALSSSYNAGSFATSLTTLTAFSAFTYSYSSANSLSTWSYTTPLANNPVFTTPTNISWVGAPSGFGNCWVISPSTYTLRSGALALATASASTTPPSSPPAAPVFTTQPAISPSAICAGTSFTTNTVAASNTPTSYQWEVSTDNGTTWANATGASAITTQLTSTPSTAGTYVYRCKATNSGGTGTSSNVTLTVNALPTITTQPTTTAIVKCYSSAADVLTVATSASSPSYQWQQSVTAGGTYTNVSTGSNFTTAAFSPSHPNIWSNGKTMYYRCLVTSNGCTTTSNVSASYKVTDLTQLAHPSTTGENVCINGSTTTLTVSADNTGLPIVYTWQSATTSNGSYSTAPGNTGTNTYTPPSSVAGTRYYRCYYNFCGGAGTASNPSGAITVTDTYTWTGATSSNPTVAGNWSPAAVPCSGANIIIPANATNFPTYNGLTIANGTTITVQAGATLTEFGVLTNNGTLTIESGATFVQKPTSSLAGTGTYNVKQTVTGAGGATPTGRFWYMGLPINNLTRAAAFGAASGSNRLWSWSESGQVWSSQITDATTLTPTTGYVFRTGATSTTLNFSGTSLYSANASITGLTNSGGAFDGCHLMSNPYTAYLDWEAIVADAGTTNLASTYCVRSFNSTSSEMVYDTYNATGDVSVNPSGVAMTRYIAPMQSFWITVNPSTTGTLSMTKAMLTHQAGAVGLKDITSFPAFARLNLVSGNFYDQVVVYTDVNATAELENYDSKKFFLPNKAQVYCPVGNEKLVINALKQGKAQTSAPLTVELPSTQVYKFEMAESFVENGLVILEDKQEGIFQDMGVNPVYEFFGNSGVIADRFVLHFQLPNGTNNEGQAGIEDLTSGQIAVIANHNGAVTVALSADLTVSGDIHIFDEAGRLVAQKAITSAQTSLQLNNGMGVYFVRVQTPMKTEMKKVMVY